MQKLREKNSALYNLGIDTINYDEDFYKIIELLMEKAFSNHNKEWIDWFIYERVTPTGEILKAYDRNNKEICHDVRSLWEEVTR